MRPWHIIVLVAVFLLFFGIPKLPELARSIGKSLRIFKSETTGLMSDDVRGKDDAAKDNPTLSSESSEKSSDTSEKQGEQEPLNGDVISPHTESSREKK